VTAIDIDLASFRQQNTRLLLTPSAPSRWPLRVFGTVCDHIINVTADVQASK
jgi:hypothetical protein